MQFVKANPLRDPGVFCGSPPCPLCYDPADEQGAKDGFEAFWLNLIGETMEASRVRLPDFLYDATEKQVREAADRVHQYNLNKLKTDPFKEKMEAQQMKMWLDAEAAKRLKEANMVKRPAPTVLLDNLNLEAPAQTTPAAPPKQVDISAKQKIMAMQKEMMKSAQDAVELEYTATYLQEQETKLNPNYTYSKPRR